MEQLKLENPSKITSSHRPHPQVPPLAQGCPSTLPPISAPSHLHLPLGKTPPALLAFFFPVLSTISLPRGKKKIPNFEKKKKKKTQFKPSLLFSRAAARSRKVVVIYHICCFYALFSCQGFHKRCCTTPWWLRTRSAATIRSPRELSATISPWVFVSERLRAQPAMKIKESLLSQTQSAVVF